MKRGKHFFIGILCGIGVFFLPGCVTPPPVSPLQSAAAQTVLEAPKSPERWVEYGRACFFSNNPYGAEAAFRNAIELDGQYVPAYKHLAVALVTLQRQSEAEKVYQEAIDLSANDSELRTAYGYCLIDSGKDKEALESFRKSIELNADPMSVVSARLGISALLRRQGDEIGAQHEYDETIRMNPEIVKILDEQKGLAGTRIINQSQETVP